MRFPVYPGLRATVTVSLILHLGLFLVPRAWLAGALGGRGDAAPPSPLTFVVSLFRVPEPEAETPPLQPQPETETPPETEPEPTVPVTEVPVTEASAPEAKRGAAGSAPEADPVANQGIRSEEGVPGEGETEVRNEPLRLLVGALPIDPEEAKRLQAPPEIPVRLRVGVDGRVLEMVPEDENLSEAIRRALERSARAMRFQPALRDGQPVEAWFFMSFEFRR